MTQSASDELYSFIQHLQSVTDACNAYIANQIPEKAETAVHRAQRVIEGFAENPHERIRQEAERLKQALQRDRSGDANPEASLVEEIRAITDIVEPYNLSLVVKGQGETPTGVKLQDVS